jgi:hypothetical protein
MIAGDLHSSISMGLTRFGAWIVLIVCLAINALIQNAKAFIAVGVSSKALAYAYLDQRKQMTSDPRSLLEAEADDNGITQRQQAIITLKTIDFSSLKALQSDAVFYCIELLNDIEEEAK